MVVEERTGARPTPKFRPRKNDAFKWRDDQRHERTNSPRRSADGPQLRGRDQTQPLVDRAAEAYARGLYSEAAELLKRQLGASPSDLKAMILLARTCANQGNLSNALTWCEKALAIEKLDLSLHLLKATILQEQGRADDAVASLRSVLFLNPRHLLARFALGNIFHQQGLHPDAAREFASVLQFSREYRDDEVVPDSEGITAGRLREIVQSTLRAEPVS